MTITQLFVDSIIADDPMVADVSRRLGISPRIIEGPVPLYSDLKVANDPWQSGKQMLLLTRQKGRFLKSCPGTREYLCCDYKILHMNSYCTMDCAYCILQAYFHPPVLQMFINHDDLLQELTQTLNGSGPHRIGTGEFTDSLIWESCSDITKELVTLFASQNHSVLELKTKTANIDFLSDIDHRQKTITAWSLNTPYIIRTQERRTASLNARLKAAAQCQAWGYPLAFHFDPIILYPGCEEAYHKVIESLFEHVRAEGIVWISMGAFRYIPALRQIIQQRFPESDIVYGEFVPGLDGKMRYFKLLRVRMYHLMTQWIKEFAPDATVYLCMEDDTVWSQSLGFSPQSKGGLPAMLNRSIRRQCGCT